MTGSDQRALRVAIVGSGPAGMYAAGHLLEGPAGTYLGGKLIDMVDRPFEVDVFDRLPTPWGLVRGGVAPDHPEKKRVSTSFEAIAGRPGFRFFGNLDVGVDVTPAELAAWYDAVIYAVGAGGNRELSIPGSQLNGHISAGQFVAWYNGHPDHSHVNIDLSCERAVIVGNGNVALDVARILTLDLDTLQRTDISDTALTALRHSAVREVIIVGRRGPSDAAFSLPELEELGHLDAADVVIDNGLAETLGDLAPGSTNRTQMRKLQTLRQLAARPRRQDRKRIRFRFFTSPVRLLGDRQVTGVVVDRNDVVARPDGTIEIRAAGEESVIQTALVISAIGYQSAPLTGLPFDRVRCTIPHRGGRVVDADMVIPGSYVAGWIKRGPTGIIGTNKKCARETVHSLIADASAGQLDTSTTLSAGAVADLICARKPDVIPYSGWKAIDRGERHEGLRAGRPRVKYLTSEHLVTAAFRHPELS